MNEIKKIPHFFRRCVFLCLSLLVMAFGVAFSINADLGTSPISSLPYVLSMFTPLTVGTATICMHCVLILLQILILRKKYHIFQLLQLPVAFLFGYLTDFALRCIRFITYTAYWQQWLLCAVGICLVALGVSMEVMSRVVTLAGEGFVLAVCQVRLISFSSMKVAFDVTLVSIACVLSFLFVGGLHGVREGTVAAAVCVGLLSRQFTKLLSGFDKRFLSQDDAS